MPRSVPSVAQSPALPKNHSKRSRLPTTPRMEGRFRAPPPCTTCTVPRSVPSLRQTPPPAANQIRPRNAVSVRTCELSGPRARSATRCVPAGVPSVRHSSVP